MAGKAVATKKDQVPAVGNYGDYASAGFETVRQEDLAIPFLAILHTTSPQVEDDNPKGAKAGMLFNTVTQELYDGDAGVVFQPCYFENDLFIEWVPRNKGGGFVGAHRESDKIVQDAIKANGGSKFGKLVVGDGHELIETHQCYGLILDADGKESICPAVVSFTSTRIKPGRDFMTALKLVKGKPPVFAFRSLLRTKKEQNDSGTWYNWVIEPFGGGNWIQSLISPDNTDLLDEGHALYQSIGSGQRQAAYDTAREAEGAGAGGEEEIPF